MLSYTDKRKIGELLSVLLNDQDFSLYSDKINEETVKYTEDLLLRLSNCNKATTALFTGIKCIPKSPNVYGWLISCGSAMLDGMISIIKINHSVFYSNLLCTTGVQTHRDALKATLLNGYF